MGHFSDMAFFGGKGRRDGECGTGNEERGAGFRHMIYRIDRIGLGCLTYWVGVFDPLD